MKNLYIRLDGAFADKGVLAKKVSENLLLETLDTVIMCMCDSTPDEFNHELAENPGSCYTAQEVRKAELIEEALDDGLNYCITVKVDALSVGGNSLVELGRNGELRTATIADKKNEILRKLDLDGKQYYIVDLKMSYLCPGG
ncbi:hypothetical protein HOK51_02110 [Candidatus Woesearchaeota archaeon]|jgi:hypothetical protein|nr:hypothetical protein [Candidatus Woesearchaeota archaeon]MBT6518610.1 hypothetical protein [Candidatus Woesearchaeota archaeon]MBT7368750.1 hypothetical protein [Candidatus Woesearchaeota archaeon]